MRCSNCNNEIRDDAKFCPYCGAAVQPAGQQPYYQQPVYQQPAESQSVYQEPVAEQPYYQQSAEPQPAYQESATEQQPAPEKPVKKGVSTPLFIIVTALLFVICACLGGALYYEITELQKANGYLADNMFTMEDLNDQITELKNTNNLNESRISSLENEVSGLEAENEALRDDSYDYEEIVSSAGNAAIGYSSDNFYTKTPVVVMKSTDSTRTVTCVDKYNGYHSIHVDTDGYSAGVSWASETWTEEAHLQITPYYKGVTRLKISNTMNTATYTILVIVTD